MIPKLTAKCPQSNCNVVRGQDDGVLESYSYQGQAPTPKQYNRSPLDLDNIIVLTIKSLCSLSAAQSISINDKLDRGCFGWKQPAFLNGLLLIRLEQFAQWRLLADPQRDFAQLALQQQHHPAVIR